MSLDLPALKRHLLMRRKMRTITTDTKMIPTISHSRFPFIIIIVILLHSSEEKHRYDPAETRAAAAFQLQPDDRKDERSPLPLSDSVCRLFLYLWSQNQTDSLRSTGTFHCQVKNHSSVSEQLLNEQFIIYHFCLLSA